MARLRRPSLREINIYNKLVEQQNKVRKKLLVIHKKNEEASGAGRLPALIVPKKAKKIRTNMFYGLDKQSLKRRLQAFWGRYHEAKSLFGKGIKSYLSRVVKDGYINLWKEQIQEKFGLLPEGSFGRFSPEQIKENSDVSEFLIVYNQLIGFSPEVFLALLYEKKIIQFTFIYQEMNGLHNDKENTWIHQQYEMLSLYRSPKARNEVMVRAGISEDRESKKIYSEDEVASTYSGKHNRDTMNKARAEQHNYEARIARQAEKAKGGK